MNKLYLSPLSLLLLSSISLATTQQNWGRPLLTSGDTLSNGQTVQSVVDGHITDDAGWAALVYPTGQAFGQGAVVVQNGRVTHGPGTLLSTGEPIQEIWSMDYDPDGKMGLIVGVGGDTALVVDDDVVLRRSDPISGTGIPAGAILGHVNAVRISWPYALVLVRMSFPGQPSAHAALRLNFSGGGPPSIEMLAASGDPHPMGSVSFLDPTKERMAIAHDGSYAFFARFLAAPSASTNALITSNGLVGIFGAPAPFSGTTWNLVNPNLGIAAGGQLAISSMIFFNPSVSETGAVVGPAGGLLKTGDPIPGIPGAVVDGFFSQPISLDRETLETAYIVPGLGTPSNPIGKVLLVDSKVILFDNTDPALAVGFDMQGVEIGDKGKLILLNSSSTHGQGIRLFEHRVGDRVACQVTANSTGAEGSLVGSGSSFVSDDLTLQAQNLPIGQFGLLLVSDAQGFAALPAGSQGNLCLGGSIGRFNNLVQASGPQGTIAFPIDLSQLPTPTGPASAVAGETWFFQTWHRDQLPSGASTSNFTSALSVQLR